MASMTEQFAANFNFGALAKADDLKARLKFTVLALLIYRLGTYVPVPGIDPQAWQEIFSQKSGGIFDMFNMFSGGALQRMTIFTMGIMPYITASIIMQMMTAMVPSLENLKKKARRGVRKSTNIPVTERSFWQLFRLMLWRWGWKVWAVVRLFRIPASFSARRR